MPKKATAVYRSVSIPREIYDQLAIIAKVETRSIQTAIVRVLAKGLEHYKESE